eukprot:SM000001S04612  [mRNA]  locus=s1:1273186:1273876:+ [translate_table: standard]
MPAQDEDQAARFLALLQDYHRENAVGAKAVDELKARRARLQAELSSATSSLVHKKELVQAAEEEAKGLSVELESARAALAAKQQSILGQQSAIAQAKHTQEVLKEGLDASREAFLNIMAGINAEIKAVCSIAPASDVMAS